ncbi:Delta-aminolevulinic acid dehydratase [compost metagenome]
MVRRAADTFNVPIYAYQVSGEYAMIEMAGAAGAINRDAAVLESLWAFKRAGADGVLTYYALEMARKLGG